MHQPDAAPDTVTPVAKPAPQRVWERLLGPLGENAFFSHYWEQTPLHVERSDSERFHDWISVSDIEQLLGCCELFFPRVQLSRVGDPVQAGAYTDGTGRILPSRLIALHGEGATLIVSQAQQLFPRLAAYCRALQQLLQWRCQTNVYLSPAGAQGFATHYDTHDVFVLQVSGQKTFRFHRGGVELPFCDERFDPALRGEPQVERSVTLAAGDTLYIPRGVLHDALADGDSASLHITVGVFPVVLRDVCREMLQIAAEHDVALRQAVPQRDWRFPGDRHTDLQTTLETLLRASLHPEILSEALSRLRDEVWIDLNADCRGRLAPQRHAVHIGLRHRIVVRRTQAAGRGERTHGELKWRSSGELLEFQEPFSTAVERLIEAGSALVGDLAGLTTAQQLALARQLQRHGVVDVETTD